MKNYLAPLAPLAGSKLWLQERGVPNESYNSLDEWLNCKEYDKFMQLFEKVKLVEDMDGLDIRENKPNMTKSKAGYVRNGVPTLLDIKESIAEWCDIIALCL